MDGRLTVHPGPFDRILISPPPILQGTCVPPAQDTLNPGQRRSLSVVVARTPPSATGTMRRSKFDVLPTFQMPEQVESDG